MSRHRSDGPDPESGRNGTPRGRDRGGVNGRPNGAAPRNGRPRPRPDANGSGPVADRRGSRAQPSWIADFARSSGSETDGRATATSRIPAARNGAGVEGTVAHGPVVPAQRDRSGDSGPHRTPDDTVALPARRPAPRSAVPGPRPAPARPPEEGPAPGGPGRVDEPGPAADAVSTERVAPVRPAATRDTAGPVPTGPGPVDRGGSAPTPPATAAVPATTAGPAPPDTTLAAADPDATAVPTTPAAPAPPVTGAVPADPAAAAGRAAAEPGGNRLLGVDVARGVALFGIIAVHALVEGTDDGAPATNYLVFGGRSAALFALLAGVALAFMTGRRRVRWGRAGFGGAAAMIAARAGVLLVIGLALGWTDPEIAAVILPYYAVMFLLAIPLLTLPTGVLAGLTVALVGAVPVLSQLVRPGLPVPTLDNPHLVDLVTDPLGLLSELTVTGAYPAATWLAYLAAGLVIGRLRLSSVRTAWTLFAAGAAAALAAAGASWWLLGPAGGYAHIAAATAPAQLETAPTVADFVAVFPDGVTPTTTWWWLATIAPHSGTPLDLVQTIGSAAAVLGAALLLAGISRPAVARPLGHVLRPVAAAGSMTLTLYVTSLLFMNSALDDYGPLDGYLWQIGAALVIGTAWRRAVGRGPLEAATSSIAKAARDRVRRGRERDRVGGAALPGPSVADGQGRR